MKKLKNWDNQTWLSSKNYINQFNKFLNKRVRFNKNTKILDIGCGRANIISTLQKRYKFREKPIGLDIMKNKGVKKNIIFKKMRKKLDSSLKRDEKLFKIIKRKLKKTNESYFNYKVNISKQKYLKMVKSRYISCLLDLKNNEISRGISELKSKYKYQIKFTDTLKCISYKK